MYGKVKMAAAYAAVLIGLTFATGSLISCGPFSSDEKPGDVQTVADIIVERDETIPEYYSQDGDETVIKTGVLTSYSITASSNNEAAGYVEYETGYSESGQTVTATATARTGYVLDHWMINGEEATALGSEQTVEIKDITENVSLVAVFVTNSATVGPLTSDPPILRGPNPLPTTDYNIYTYVTSGQETYGRVSGGLASNNNTAVQINATANTGYEFVQWDIIFTNKDGSTAQSFVESSNPYTIYLKTEGTAKCTAFFRKKSVNISLASMSPDSKAGSVEYTHSSASGSTVESLVVGDAPKPYNHNEVISVKSQTGYYIDNVSFTDPMGVTHTYRPNERYQTEFTFQIPVEYCIDDIYLHAEFRKTEYTIKVTDDTVERGSSTIEYSYDGHTIKDTTVTVPSGANATITSTPENGYVFDYYITSGGTKIAGTPDISNPRIYHLVLEDIGQDITVTARYKKMSANVTIEPSPSASSAGLGDGGGTVQFNDEAVTDVKGEYTYDTSKEGFMLTAYPSDGYIFLRWEDSIGNVFNNKQITVVNLEEDRKYTAIFKKKQDVMVTIKPSPAASSPGAGDEGGTVQYNDGPEVSTKTVYTFYSPEESGFTLTAHPKDGYKFVCWEDSVGNVFNSKQVRIADLDDDREYTAVFTEDRETVKVNIEPSPGAGGTVQYNDNPEVTSKTEYVYKPREESGFTLTANPNEGYRFVCWDDSVGNTYNNKQIRISDLTEDRTYTAVFYEEKTDITVNIEPSPNDGGTVQYNDGPEVSTKTAYTFHPLTESGFTLSANPKEGYEFLCWQDSVGNVLSGRQIRIAELLEDRDYTAVFAQKKSDVRVSIEPSPEEGGTVRYNGEGEVTTLTEYIYHPQTETGFTLSASPRTGYKFQCWEDSAGNVFNTKSIRISNLLEDRTYTAVFISEDDSEGKGLRVVSEPPSGGHVRRWAADESGKAELTAYPEPGWYFVGWKKEGIGEGIFSRSKRVIVDDENVTYLGCFKKDKDYRPTTDIAEMHFYNEKRRVTRPNYSVTRQTMENLAAVSVEYDRVRGANDLPATHGYKATADVKSYLEGKLAASEIILVEGILTTTKGEVIGTGNITDIDVLMNSAKDITNRKFGERYDSEIVAAVNTQPPADFDGKVRTYLWKETDTQYNDNIYIMYSDKGSDYKETAAIVDEDGTVRFTLEDDLTGTQFVLVRVTIEDNGEKKE